MGVCVLNVTKITQGVIKNKQENNNKPGTWEWGGDIVREEGTNTELLQYIV